MLHLIVGLKDKYGKPDLQTAHGKAIQHLPRISSVVA